MAGVGPIEVQNALVTDKIQDVQQRGADNKNIVLAQEQQFYNELKSKTVLETEKSEGKDIDPNEQHKREEQQRQNKERRKEIEKKLMKDMGHIIDLEA